MILSAFFVHRNKTAFYLLVLLMFFWFPRETLLAQSSARTGKKTSRKPSVSEPEKITPAAPGQLSGTPEEKIRNVLKAWHRLQSGSLAAARNLLTSEVTEAAIIYLPDDQPDKVQFIDERNAVARFPQSGSGGDRDVYVFLTDPGTWKIRAFRCSDRSAFTSQIRYLYSARVTDENQQDLDYEMKQALLALSLDEDLKKWFAENQKALARLIQLSRDLPLERMRVPVVDRKNQKGAVELLFQLGLDSIERLANGNVEILVGESNNDQIGFLYSPSNMIPQMKVNDYFWVEKLADAWHLIRRTSKD